MIEFRRGSLVGLIAASFLTAGAAGASGVTVVAPDAAGSGPIAGRLV